MAEIYLHFLNNYLINIIVSELSLKDLNNFILLEIYKQINWKHLFVYKFSNELYPNFKDFNSKDLYVGMLK